MSRNYKFHNPESAYFVSFAVVEWIDVFTRNEYKKILLDSLTYCQQNKGMEIYAWCIMTNHVHLAFRSVGALNPGQILGDFKRHTSKAVLKLYWKIQKKVEKKILLQHLKKQPIKLQVYFNFNFGDTIIIL